MKQVTLVGGLFLVTFTLLGRLDMCDASKTNGANAPVSQIQAAYQDLLTARTFGDMLTQTEHWKDDRPSRDALCLTLLEHLRSKDVLEMDEQGNRSTAHDLWMVGGRCAWAIEKLLKRELPPVTPRSTPKQIGEVRSLVIQILSETEEKEAIQQASDLVKSLGLSEKRRLAQDAGTSPSVLTRLADEEDVVTRRSVAANPKTAPSILARLAGKDADDEVRERAVKNLEVSRTLLDGKKIKSE
jgi:hypothetical protein